MTKPGPSLLHILLIQIYRVQWSGIIALIVLVVGLYSSFAGTLLKPTLPEFYIWSVVAFLSIWLLVSITSSVYYYRKLISFIAQGHKRAGRVIEKTSTHLTYEYKFQGRIYRAAEYFIPLNFSLKFQVGQAINILVNNQSPSHALLYELYL